MSESKFSELITLYKTNLTELGVSVDEALLTNITKNLGPSIYNEDSSRVSSSDPTEIETVKNNFLVKKLGLTEGKELDTIIEAAVQKMGTSNKNKWRAVLYYLMVKHTGKEAVFN